MLKFDDKGLIPVIVQDAKDGTVLMLGYASKESLRLTLEQGEMVFWSRSRKELWHKGEHLRQRAEGKIHLQGLRHGHFACQSRTGRADLPHRQRVASSRGSKKRI